MPLDANAQTEVTAFRWVPPFAAGLVRDHRVRWALEEIGRPYKVRLLDALHPRPDEYLSEQPFGQVPAFRDDEVQLFESGAILIHLGLQDEALLPADPSGRMRGIAWLIAALNSVEPPFFELGTIDLFQAGEDWTKERRPQVIDQIHGNLARVASALGDREWLEDRFTIGDLMMVSVLRGLRHTKLVTDHPTLGPYVARGEARPAFQRGLADQLAVFEQNQPEGAVA
ncbi:MAG: glutathione S-transferase family protein [Sphingomonas sp.]|nr:glutathione S-transferase family protein [Sphingomonas sp.]